MSANFSQTAASYTNFHTKRNAEGSLRGCSFARMTSKYVESQQPGLIGCTSSLRGMFKGVVGVTLICGQQTGLRERRTGRGEQKNLEVVSDPYRDRRTTARGRE